MRERPWYQIKARADDRHAEIYIYEQIGEDWLGEGVAAKRFVSELAALDVDAIALHINSPGGSVFDGQAIFNAIARHPATVTTYVDGVAASIASVVALAADRVVMARNALYMIHDPFAVAMGTAEDMRKMADVLDQVAGTIRGVYVERTGASEEDVRAAMAAETWYTADEALAMGFCDEVEEPLPVAACLERTFDFKALGFRHAPAATADVSAAGRVLSATNEKDLADARDLIDGVLGQASDTKDQSTPAPAAEATAVPPAEGRPATDLVHVRGRTLAFTKER